MQKDLKQEINENLNKFINLINNASGFDCEAQILKEANRALDMVIADINFYIEEEEFNNRDKREDFDFKGEASFLRSQQL